MRTPNPGGGGLHLTSVYCLLAGVSAATPRPWSAAACSEPYTQVVVPRLVRSRTTFVVRRRCEKNWVLARVIRDRRKTRSVHVRTGYQARPASESSQMNCLLLRSGYLRRADGPSAHGVRKM